MNSTKYDNELNSAEKLSVEEKGEQEEQEEQEEEEPVEEKPVEEKPVEEKPVEEKPVEEKPVEEKKRKKKQRCEHCRVKLGLFTFTCKCGMILCQTHLSPHNHSCSFDYMKEKKDLIEKNNPKLGEKFIRI
jgi:hypothetical protein